jgi:glycosyltransferase involved in cell wall biosynthesis
MITVSVAVTTYNRKESFYKSLAGVIEQTSRANEIIVVDDHSEENYIDICKLKVCQSNLLTFRLDQNRGLANARNTAIMNSTCDFFTWCDDDDFWNPQLLERVRRAIANMPSYIGAYLIYPRAARRYHEQALGNFPVLRDVISAGYTPPVSSQVYRTDLLKAIGGYNKEIKTGVDHDLWFSLLRRNPRVGVIWEDLCTVNFKDHSQRITTDVSARLTGILESLSIWRPLIIDYYSEEFFERYREAYISYIRTGFISMGLRRGDIACLSKLRITCHDVLSILRRQVSLRLLRRGGLPTLLL